VTWFSCTHTHVDRSIQTPTMNKTKQREWKISYLNSYKLKQDEIIQKEGKRQIQLSEFFRNVCHFLEKVGLVLFVFVLEIVFLWKTLQIPLSLSSTHCFSLLLIGKIKIKTNRVTLQLSTETRSVGCSSFLLFLSPLPSFHPFSLYLSWL